MAVLADQGTGEGCAPSHGVGRQMAFANHFYFYSWDREWGPAFITTNAGST